MSRAAAGWLAALALGGGAYGAVMGAYEFTPARWPQAAYSAAKVPLLLAATTGIALPSFWVVNTLLGLRDDFAQALRAVVRSQSAVAAALAGLAPLTAFWYATVPGYHVATAFNGAMFLAASAAAQVGLRRAYRPLVRRDRRHRLALFAWLAVYWFVGVQMGWTLRPFVGDPSREPVFLRHFDRSAATPAGTNAYVAVYEVVRGALVGR